MNSTWWCCRRSSGYPGPDRDQLLLTHQFARTGRDGMVMAARPAVGADQDRLFEFLRRRAQDAADLEAERLLYVACTRAKWQLHLTATVDARGEDRGEDRGEASVEAAGDSAETAAQESDTGQRRKPRAGSLLAVLWPTVGEQFSAAARQASAADFACRGRCSGVARRPAAPRTRRLVAGQRVRASRRELLRFRSPLREETPVFDWAGETARRVGSLVHAELQAMDIERSDEAAIRARACALRALAGAARRPRGAAGTMRARESWRR